MSREDYCYYYSAVLPNSEKRPPPLTFLLYLCYSNPPIYLYCTTTLFTTNIDKESNKVNSNYCLQMPLSLNFMGAIADISVEWVLKKG